VLLRAALWALVAILAGWAVVRSLGLEHGYPLVPLLAYTPYVAIGAVLVTVAAALRRDRAAAVVAGLAALVLVAGVAPRALGDGADAGAQDGPRLRVMSTNLHHGLASAEEVVALARRSDVDVLSLQEVDAGGIRDLEQAGLGELLPERVVALSRGDHGTALFTLVPIEARTADPATWNAQATGAIEVPGSGPVELTAVHPPAPINDTRVGAWHRDLRALPAADRDGPIRILAGDFNATLDHGDLRRLRATGYRDAADAVGAGLRPTWPVGRRMLPVTIDHVLVDERCGIRAVALHEISGSDHRTLIADVILPPAG
jgi:endonuclease/exonuclease/phosphatase (EEP) superfamily protein YafD